MHGISLFLLPAIQVEAPRPRLPEQVRPDQAQLLQLSLIHILVGDNDIAQPGVGGTSGNLVYTAAAVRIEGMNMDIAGIGKHALISGADFPAGKKRLPKPADIFECQGGPFDDTADRIFRQVERHSGFLA